MFYAVYTNGACNLHLVSTCDREPASSSGRLFEIIGTSTTMAPTTAADVVSTTGDRGVIDGGDVEADGSGDASGDESGDGSGDGSGNEDGEDGSGNDDILVSDPIDSGDTLNIADRDSAPSAMASLTTTGGIAVMVATVTILAVLVVVVVTLRVRRSLQRQDRFQLEWESDPVLRDNLDGETYRGASSFRPLMETSQV